MINTDFTYLNSTCVDTRCDFKTGCTRYLLVGEKVFEFDEVKIVKLYPSKTSFYKKVKFCIEFQLYSSCVFSCLVDESRMKHVLEYLFMDPNGNNKNKKLSLIY